METQRIAAILRQSPDFSFVAAPEILTLADQCRLLRVRAGDPLWRQGDPVKEVFIPESGAPVRAGRMNADGSYINTALTFQGHVLGQIELFAGIATRFNMSSALADCDVVQVPGAAFLKFVASTAWAQEYWLRAASVRHSMAIKQVYALARRTARDRLRAMIGVLLEYMPLMEGSQHKLPLRQDVLGRMVDLSRPTTSTILAEWEKLGVISTAPLELTVIDPGFFVEKNGH